MGNDYLEIRVHNDGTYKRTSIGHYGNPIFEGTYRIYNDTIELNNGYDSSSGTLNKYYLISTYHNKFATEKQGRIIDLTNLYEYYNNNHNYESQINRIVQIEITDSSSKVVKLFASYIPKDFLTKKHLIDLSWCVEFYDFPQKLKKAYFEKPDIVNQKDGLFLVNIFNKDEMLSEHFYIGSIISGIKPETMRLEYIQGTNKVKKITDSKDGSNYNFEYDFDDNVKRIDYLTNDNKIISKLSVIQR